jgi:hypothetical protein
VLVDNEKSPHAVERYLGKRQTGQTAYDALTGAR